MARIKRGRKGLEKNASRITFWGTNLEVGKQREECDREGHVAQPASRDALVEAAHTELRDNSGRRLASRRRCCRSSSARRGCRRLALQLHAQLDDLHRVRGRDLEESRERAAQHLLPEPDAPIAVALGEVLARDVVDGQLDGLLGRDADQVRAQPAVEPARALEAHDLAEAVDRPVVERRGARGRGAHVLHARLDHVEREDDGRAEDAGQAADDELGGQGHLRGGWRLKVMEKEN